MHGYEIRQRLEKWNAEEWSNIAYGSIYFSLKKMASEDLLTLVDPEDESKPAGKIVYQITSLGKETLLTMLREQWWNLKSIIDPLATAISFMQYMPKDELILALEHRIDAITGVLKSTERLVPIRMKSNNAPRHIEENFNLYMSYWKAQLEWAKSALKKIKADELP